MKKLKLLFSISLFTIIASSSAFTVNDSNLTDISSRIIKAISTSSFYTRARLDENQLDESNKCKIVKHFFRKIEPYGSEPFLEYIKFINIIEIEHFPLDYDKDLIFCSSLNKTTFDRYIMSTSSLQTMIKNELVEILNVMDSSDNNINSNYFEYKDEYQYDSKSKDGLSYILLLIRENENKVISPLPFNYNEKLTNHLLLYSNDFNNFLEKEFNETLKNGQYDSNTNFRFLFF